MKLKLFEYNLPKELIAQTPTKPRDHSRLFIYDKNNDKIQHKHFYDLPEYLAPGDVLVFNNTKVFPARLLGKKDSGGKIEIFLLKQIKGKNWQVLIGGHRHQIGTKINFNKNLNCQITKINNDNTWQVEFNLSGKKFWEQINKCGQTPTPPYIKNKSNLKDYQTVYAKTTGSVAAPTAGFHFTKSLISKLKKQNVQIEFVTLHVGLGTFAPVKTEDIKKHQLHQEWASVDKPTARRLNQAKKQGRRIIAVGTTSIRTLEAFSENKKNVISTVVEKINIISNETEKSIMSSRANEVSREIPALPAGRSPFRLRSSRDDKSTYYLHSGKQWVDIFIYPGYKFKFVDSVITNFHLPKSTLLMLIAAFLSDNKSQAWGIRKIKKLYQIAIQKKYRFYSFGDGMFIR